MLGLALALLCTAVVGAAPVPLLFGVVRDVTGKPVDGAEVQAFDGSGRSVGSGQTDAAGTFAVPVSDAAAAVVVTCIYCAQKRVSVRADSSEPLVIIVARYRALSERALSQNDFQDLPYRRPSDSVGLLPYQVPYSSNGTYGGSVTDRGLDLGYSLVLDQGAPTYDLSGQVNAFSTLPDRAVMRVDSFPAADAFRYGNYAGGGTYVLDERGVPSGAATFDSGVDGTLAGYGWVGHFAPSFAESRDSTDWLIRQRGGLDYESDFAGGVLRVGAAAADQDPSYDVPGTAFNDNLLHLEYATASRRYRTFVSAAASETNVQSAPSDGNLLTRSNALVGNFRLEHPGFVTTAIGFSGQVYNAAYDVPGFAELGSRLTNALAYFEASGSDGPLSFNTGLSLSQLGLRLAYDGGSKLDTLTAALPSATVKYALGDGFSLRGSASGAFRTGTLPELLVSGPLQTNPFERTGLDEGGLEWTDASRIRVGAMAFSEHLTGFIDRNVTGIGASLEWQIAPLISVRAWSLNNSGEQTSPPLLYLPSPPLALSRGVVWVSYENPGAVRVDAIFHRDVVNGPAQNVLDADLVVPLTKGFAATVGTSRSGGVQTFYAGLRLR